MSRRTMVLAILSGLAVVAALAVPAAAGDHVRTYEVTITNLADGQPLSPPVAATHRKAVRLFRVGGQASGAIEAIAEDGDQSAAVAGLTGAKHVFDVVDVGAPLTPAGTVVGPFTDSVTFGITARAGDRFSLATMLICTNDGFTGADGVKLPAHGTQTYALMAYDAGTEDNTELSADIVDPCSALGPVALAGDPNGNEDAAVDTMPHQAIAPHAGIAGGGDLTPALHGWPGPIAEITITRTG